MIGVRPLIYWVFCFMKYEVFPFGKYKGIKLKDLPFSYLALAIEKFELPEDLHNEIGRIMFGMMRSYSSSKELLLTMTKKELIKFYDSRIETYEKY